MQLSARLAIAALAIALTASTAFADGELTLRTFYYKERATRVTQPMLDTRLDAGEHGSVDAHVLIDAITSASTAASDDAAPFSEKRYEGGVGYTHTRGIYQLGASGRYSTEPDYKSGFGVLHGQAELAHRNFTVGLTVGAGRDSIAQGTMHVGDLSTFLGSVSLSQILSENTLASLTYDLVYLDGFQENPYRTTSIGPELVPDQRLRNAVAGTVKWFAPRTSTTLVGSYRFYVDDWGLRAHTPEVRVIQDAGETMQLGLRYRYHRQSAVDLDPMYVSADPKLTKFDGHQFAMKFLVTGATFGFEDRLGAVQGELIIEYDIQHNDFGNAKVAHAALTIPLEY